MLSGLKVDLFQSGNTCGHHATYRILKYGYGQSVSYPDMVSRIGMYDAPFHATLIPNFIELKGTIFNGSSIGNPPVILAQKLKSLGYSDTVVEEGGASDDRIKDLLWQGIPVVILTQYQHWGDGVKSGCFPGPEFDLPSWAGGHVCIGYNFSFSTNLPTLHYWVANGYDADYLYVMTWDNIQRHIRWSDLQGLRSFQAEVLNPNTPSGLVEVGGTNIWRDAIGLLENNGAKRNHILHFNQPLTDPARIAQTGERYPRLEVSSDWGISIKSADGAIDCGSKCAHNYLIGSQVTLSVSNLPADAKVRGWSGPCQANGNSCTVNLSQSSTIKAQIDCPSCSAMIISSLLGLMDIGDEEYALSVSKSGNGSGSVKSTNGDPKIDCGSTCSAHYEDQTSVSLVALPAAGSKFDGWSNGCSSSPVCTFAMSEATNIAATFSRSQSSQRIGLTLTGSGSGVVSSSPSGINCPQKCDANFVDGTTVTLTAVGSAGSVFSGWSGGCSGNQKTCSLLATNSATVSATFDPISLAAPTFVSATGGDRQATISFTAPNNNGSGAPSGYKVTSTPGTLSASGADSPITVTGLTNGTSYTFTVVALYAAGNSAPSSPSTGVIPTNGATETGGTVIEFYHTTLDHYFITANSNDASSIDNGGAGPGWSRTGNTFKSGGNTPVCRFYGSQSPGPNSHFYTVDPGECAALKALQASTPASQKRWNFESLDFVSSPPSNGSCPSGTTPVYRAYNNGYSRGVDSNHRITSSQSAIQGVVARGWANEGVVMCAPQ
jgi:hypothetical protein